MAWQVASYVVPAGTLEHPLVPGWDYVFGETLFGMSRYWTVRVLNLGFAAFNLEGLAPLPTHGGEATWPAVFLADRLSLRCDPFQAAVWPGDRHHAWSPDRAGPSLLAGGAADRVGAHELPEDDPPPSGVLRGCSLLQGSTFSGITITI